VFFFNYRLLFKAK